MSNNLFEPYRIGTLEVKNRFVRSATWDCTADSSGAVTDTSVALYQKLAHGGVGLIISGYAFISPLGQATTGQYGVHTNEMITGLRRLTRAAHEGGTKIALQMVHAGINSGYLGRKGVTLQAVSELESVKITTGSTSKSARPFQQSSTPSGRKPGGIGASTPTPSTNST